MTPLTSRRSLPVALLVGLGVALTSCWGSMVTPPPDDVIQPEAYVPVYGVDNSKYEIKGLPAQPIQLSGKIYVWGNLLFQVETHKGIHVINYADKQNPVKLGFIQIKGCNELAVKGKTLIANNLKDLVTIDISDPLQPVEVGRVKDAFSEYYDPNFYQPAEKGKYFVCADPTKGDVVGWKLEKEVKGAYCFSN